MGLNRFVEILPEEQFPAHAFFSFFQRIFQTMVPHTPHIKFRPCEKRCFLRLAVTVILFRAYEHIRGKLEPLPVVGVKLLDHERLLTFLDKLGVGMRKG